MESRNINELIEKYFAGTSTPEEERTLRRFFRSGEIPEALQPYRAWFAAQEQWREARLDADFDRRLLSHLEQKPQPAARVRRLYPVIARVAAAIALVGGLWWVFQPAPHPPARETAIDWSQYEAKTPEEAFLLTHSALARLSKEMKRGAEKAAKEIDEISRIGR